MSAASPLPSGWRDLRHGGLLLDGQRLADLAAHAPAPMDARAEQRLRRCASADDASSVVKFVLEQVCGFDYSSGSWTRGTKVDREWGRRAVSGETVKPWHLWRGSGGALLPVFRETGSRVGVGKSRRTISQVLGWLRAGNDHLALVTNGRQWRLLFAGLDFDAWCEWDMDLWFEEGQLAPQVDALRALLQPKLWTPGSEDTAPPLLQAIRDTRKGQADLSETLGERVREAVEILIQGHGEVLKEQCADVNPADIYRAACRVAMRLVVILFAESRDLLPRDNALYHDSYGLNGLLQRLQTGGVAGSLSRRRSAWPQLLALFKLVRDGSHLPKLPVMNYGGDLFEPGRGDADDGVSRALAVFETVCWERDVLSDSDVREMLERMTRTRTRIRQGRSGTWITVPVDFSDLSSDYIGILYEGLLDYELKTAPPGEPVVFLAAGTHPALPLSRLEAMDDKAIKTLFGNLKKDAADDNGPTELADEPEDQTVDRPIANEVEVAAGPLFDESSADPSATADHDPRRTNRTRAETWARHAAQVAGLVKKPGGKLTPERRLKADTELGRTAHKLVARVVLPGEWYLVRWGGTRKGSGSFYTRPGLVAPTVQRTLRLLAYDPPPNKDGEPDRDARAAEWTPKLPEQILELKVCDPACGSGAFVLSALRFLTDALFASLQHHERIKPDGERTTMVRLLGPDSREASPGDRLGDELIPCRPDQDDFEPRLKAVLRRHVVERCIYAVDLDPLAVELCRLSLWIETMDRSLPFGFLDHKVKCGNSLIGAWFDQFAHYPVMAWKNREGGDKNHNNGVHFEKNARTKAIKAFVKEMLKGSLARFLRDPDLFFDDHIGPHNRAHANALAVLERMHDLPVHDAAARARMYRDEFVGSSAWRSIKDAMDLWCACWFWPADELAHAPLPHDFTNPSSETRKIARHIATQAHNRFFHWELEFPDVFHETSSGFNAVFGNPPWDIATPKSQEFFSNIDPLYRNYGKQEALRKQKRYFEDLEFGERWESGWLDYNSRFRFQSNYYRYVGLPFGDPAVAEKAADRFLIERGRSNVHLHNKWRALRRRHSLGFAAPMHPFRHQGSADIDLYKLFLETSHSLLQPSGRLGFVVPAGLYSADGTRPLRNLFLESYRWEWLFGIENRRKVFPIHRSYKFNPVVLQKGSSTKAVRAAFMRRHIDEWERAEDVTISYPVAQIRQFSPKSLAILEIQSQRDLDVLTKIYANGVSLGDENPSGWNIRYDTEFHSTGDSKKFPPRPLWETNGYRPDEYSRWLLGKWRPIGELWAQLGIDPSRPVAADVELEDWLFDTTAEPDRRTFEARYVHGHCLKPGDMARTDWRLRCAQPPYDRLPVPRLAVPAGVVLSREADAWIAEDDIENIALPLYQGIMIQPFVPNARGWIRGTGLGARWSPIDFSSGRWDPQYLMDAETANEAWEGSWRTKIGYRQMARSTDVRSFVSAVCPPFPCSHAVCILHVDQQRSSTVTDAAGLLNGLVFDYVVRQRQGGTNLSWFLISECVLPHRSRASDTLTSLVMRLNHGPMALAPARIGHNYGVPINTLQKMRSALCVHERMRLRCMVDAIGSCLYGLDVDDLLHVLRQCDYPLAWMKSRHNRQTLDVRGFWRVDRDKHPELRHTMLALAAFHELDGLVSDHDGDRSKAIRAFLTQNNGEGWLMPETLCLADYGVGHDNRASRPQPVANRLGPRFYDFQLIRGAEEEWRECLLHARNLLGSEEYATHVGGLGAAMGFGRALPAANMGKRVEGSRPGVMKAAEPKGHYASDSLTTDTPS